MGNGNNQNGENGKNRHNLNGHRRIMEVHLDLDRMPYYGGHPNSRVAGLNHATLKRSDGHKCEWDSFIMHPLDGSPPWRIVNVPGRGAYASEDSPPVDLADLEPYYDPQLSGNVEFASQNPRTLRTDFRNAVMRTYVLSGDNLHVVITEEGVDHHFTAEPLLEDVEDEDDPELVGASVPFGPTPI